MTENKMQGNRGNRPDTLAEHERAHVMETERRYDEGQAAIRERVRKQRVAMAVLLVVGYVLAFPALCTLFGNSIESALMTWLKADSANIWWLTIVTVAGLACWIGAALVLKNINQQVTEKPTGAKSLVRPVVTAVTLLCAFCICFALPLLILSHL